MSVARKVRRFGQAREKNHLIFRHQPLLAAMAYEDYEALSGHTDPGLSWTVWKWNYHCNSNEAPD